RFASHIYTGSNSYTRASPCSPATLRLMGPRASLTGELSRARGRTDELFALLAPGALHDRPIPERHRLILFLGHVEAFDWNQVCRGALDMPIFHPSFDKLFEFGIDPEPGKAPADRPEDWPSTEEIARYNRRARAEIDSALARGLGSEQIWR